MIILVILAWNPLKKIKYKSKDIFVYDHESGLLYVFVFNINTGIFSEAFTEDILSRKLIQRNLMPFLRTVFPIVLELKTKEAILIKVSAKLST